MDDDDDDVDADEEEEDIPDDETPEDVKDEKSGKIVFLCCFFREISESKFAIR